MRVAHQAGSISRVASISLASGLAVIVVLVSLGAWNTVNADLAFPDDSVSPPSCLLSLLDSNIDREIGDMVFLNDVTIRNGPTSRIFVAGGAQGTQLLVATEDAEPINGKVRVVDIKGILRRLPNHATLRKTWKLTQDQIHSFGQQKIYLAAEYIHEEPLSDRPSKSSQADLE